MTILNRFAGATNRNTAANPIISGLNINSANTSSITVNISALATLYANSSVTFTIIPTIYNSPTGAGCHSILRLNGYPGPDLSGSGTSYVGYTFPTTMTVYGLYYDSDYLLNIYVTSPAGTDYYSMVGSTALPDDIIITGNTNPSGVSTNFTNLNGTPIVIPRNTTLGSVLVVGAGGGGGGSALNTAGAGGGGGALAYANNIPFTPGSLLVYSVGGSGYYNTSGGNTYISNTTYLFAGGGQNGQQGIGYFIGGGGGAGGYGNNGGKGGAANTVTYIAGNGGTAASTAPSNSIWSGGVGGGSYSGTVLGTAPTNPGGGAGAGGTAGNLSGYGGGGVGLYGQSSVNNNGFTTTQGGATAAGGSAVSATNGGSGGADGAVFAQSGIGGGNYGGGGPGYGIGGKGAIRICFSRNEIRVFPSTNVGTVRTNTHQINY
jgi:hypothetical protein